MKRSWTRDVAVTLEVVANDLTRPIVFKYQVLRLMPRTRLISEDRAYPGVHT
jgi:hypothetical protein